MELEPAQERSARHSLPRSWQQLPLGELAEMRSGGTPLSSVARYYGGDIPWVSISDMTSQGTLICRTERYLTREGLANSAAQIFPTGTILYAMYASIGKCSIAGVPMSSSQAILGISPGPELDRDYLYYYLDSMRAIAKTLGQQGTQANLNKGIVQALPIRVPPLGEQRAIATALQDTDSLVAGLDRLIAKKRNLRQGALRQLISGRTRLPGFAKDWESRRLGEIAELRMGGTPSRSNPKLWGGRHQWMSIGDMQSKWILETNEHITDAGAALLTPIPAGTLVMSFKLSLGRVAFTGSAMYSNEAICSFNNLQASKEFLYYALSRTDFAAYGTLAVKGYTLNTESLKAIVVPFPELAEQNAIASVLDDMDAELVACVLKRDKAETVKVGMGQALLTGRVRLPIADQNEARP